MNKDKELLLYKIAFELCVRSQVLENKQLIPYDELRGKYLGMASDKIEESVKPQPFVGPTSNRKFRVV